MAASDWNHVWSAVVDDVRQCLQMEVTSPAFVVGLWLPPSHRSIRRQAIEACSMDELPVAEPEELARLEPRATIAECVSAEGGCDLALVW